MNRHRSQLNRTIRLVKILTIVFTQSFCINAINQQAAWAAGVDVHFLSSAKVKGADIYLSDIAEINIPNPEHYPDPATIKLGTSPKPEKSRSFTDTYLKKILDDCKWLPKKALKTIPKKIRVTRESQNIPPALLKAEAIAHIESLLNGAEFKISHFRRRGTKPLPVGQLKFVFPTRPAQALKGRVTFNTKIMIDGHEYCSLAISVWIHRFESVISARHALPRGAILNAADVAPRRIDISRNAAVYIKNETAAIGKRARRPLKAGKCLKPNMLETVPVILKGDTVKLVAKSGSLKVVTLGIAKTDGEVNGRIRVKNLTSKKEIIGTVKENGTVEIIF